MFWNNFVMKIQKENSTRENDAKQGMKNVNLFHGISFDMVTLQFFEIFKILLIEESTFSR